tara:strand:+ start:732 stop:1028 length:297 start_codon:yes stop_codon:yes gene_type:complete
MSDYYWSNGGLRRDTGESIEYVLKYLKDNNIKYKDTRNSNSILTIYNKDNKEYGYVYTTGRWSTYKGKEVKHYHSKGIEDFDTNYLNKFVKENEDDEE